MQAQLVVPKTYQLTIAGRIPSKKNCKRAIVRKGRAILLLSEAYLEWEKTQLEEMFKLNPIPFDLMGCVARFWFPDRRRSDLSNKWESIADMLVKAEILKDDRHDYLADIRLISQGVDKVNPRVELEFFEL
jgi:hypothetical protein